MQSAGLLLVLSSIGCAVAGTRPIPSALLAGDLGLPQPREALVIRKEATSLQVLVDELARVTGQFALVDYDVQGDLRSVGLRIEEPLEIPAAEVYAFAEGVLFRNGFVMAVFKGGERPQFAVYAIRGNVSLQSAPWLEVEPADAPGLASHPALLVQTVIETPSLEVRQVATSLRALMSDPNSQALLPIGDHTLLLRGNGAWVADMVEILLRTERAESARRKAAPPS